MVGCRHIQLQRAIFVSLRDLQPHDHQLPPNVTQYCLEQYQREFIVAQEAYQHIS